MKLPLFALFCAFSLHAQIVEISHFEEAFDYIQPESLIILDIDDTLITTAQGLGGDSWFEWRISYYRQAGFSLEEALNNTFPEYEAIQLLTKVKLLESSTPDAIRKMQQTNRVISVTARGFAMATCTCKQLRSVGIDLSESGFSSEDQFLNFHHHGALYRKGILFCAGHPKGLSLFYLCRKNDYLPQHLVAIDDKRKCLEQLESEASKRNIPFIGLRYNRADADKAAFSPEMAEKAWLASSFHHLVSDEERLCSQGQ